MPKKDRLRLPGSPKKQVFEKFKRGQNSRTWSHLLSLCCTSSCFWPKKNQDLYNRKSYSGCWKNSLFHGNGHIIYHDGSIYKGKFVEGERNGVGTFYYPVGKTNRVLIRGVFEPFGYGAIGKLSTDPDHPVTVIFTNGNVFTGQVDPSNHVLSGHGTVLFAENDRKNRKMFVGNFKKNTFHGFGTMTYSKPTVKNLYDILNNPVSYQGNWVYGKKDGKTLVKFSDSYPNTVTSFSGDYENDAIVNNDIGHPAKWTFKNGNVFIGNMKEIFDRDGYTKYLIKCNRGTLIYAKNSTHNPEKISEYTGHFRQNRWNLPETLPNGPPGIMIWRNGANYTGKFIDNFRTDNTGKAIYFYPKRKKSKKLKYVGQFLKNKFQNNGKIYYKNGNSYQGHFHQNKMHGEGKFCYQKKKICSVGEYWDDKKEGEFKFTKITDGSYFITKFHEGKEMKQYREYYDERGRKVSGKKMKRRRSRKDKGRRRRKI